MEELSPPAVRMPVPSVTVPAPASEPIVSAKLFRLKVAPPATVRALVSAMRFAAPKVSVPALMVVAPVYVFAPERVKIPVPCFVNPPAPLKIPV